MSSASRTSRCKCCSSPCRAAKEVSSSAAQCHVESGSTELCARGLWCWLGAEAEEALAWKRDATGSTQGSLHLPACVPRSSSASSAACDCSAHSPVYHGSTPDRAFSLVMRKCCTAATLRTYDFICSALPVPSIIW